MKLLFTRGLLFVCRLYLCRAVIGDRCSDRLKENFRFLYMKRVAGYTKLPAFIPIFPQRFKKNVYLCNTFFTHRRDEIGGKRFYFITEYIKYCLSESKFSDLNHREMMRQIFHANGLYQHIRKGCVIYK